MFHVKHFLWNSVDLKVSALRAVFLSVLLYKLRQVQLVAQKNSLTRKYASQAPITSRAVGRVSLWFSLDAVFEVFTSQEVCLSGSDYQPCCGTSVIMVFVGCCFCGLILFSLAGKHIILVFQLVWYVPVFMPQSGGYSCFAVLHWYFVLYIVFFGIITISKSGDPVWMG